MNWKQRVLLCIVGIVLSCSYVVATEVASPPPENAALLYYQVVAHAAHSRFKYPSEDSRDILEHFQEKPSSSTRQLVECPAVQRIVELFLLATRTEKCDWGFTVPPGSERLWTTTALRRLQRVYVRYVDAVVGILDSETSYYATRARREELEGDTYHDPNTSSLIDIAGMGWLPGVNNWYDKHIRRVAHIHAIRTAIQVYRVKARTGQLPQALPKGYWLDPYSGKDFEYQITQDGFTLRCDPTNRTGVGAPPSDFHYKVAKKTGD